MIIAATGHRPDKLGGYGQAAEKARRRMAVEALQVLRSDTVISGMALGWDQAIACAALDLGLHLIAAVPFAGQEKAWPENSQREYRRILAQANETEVVCAGGFSKQAMQLRNEWMADHCDVMLALWDGSPGGTGNCVRYCRKIRRAILNVWPDWSQR